MQRRVADVSAIGVRYALAFHLVVIICITLVVQKMVCDFCTSAVSRSLEAIPGVAKARVSLEDKTALVTYDDTKVDVKTLISATAKAGYPSTPKA